ncbi:hypothetical protein ACJIZ3_024129 [Penstemon smallii]|uniref:Dof zinc finger protein n=1 Tax=Penstemon smallii TaxID=265156 RepID=A0ABD3TU28_9LAMI
MVFSSIPAYLDPSNWQQHQNHQIIGSSTTNPLLPPPPHPGPPLPPPPQQHGSSGTGSGSIRPGSMSERARMANIPLPEPALKCPRCESTNTKFCYFNNYNLSQPRHFCKTCRRYWTRGGALRSVPVGGGCRRNKRCSKSTTSKSPSQTTSTSTSTMLGPTPQLPPLRFMSPLSQLTDNFTNDMGFSYSGISSPVVGTSDMASLMSNDKVWTVNNIAQFPFLSGLDTSPSPSGIYQFQGGESGFLGGGEGNHQHQVRPKFANLMNLSSHEIASVKSEENEEMNMSRELLGVGIPGNDQWNSTPAAAWTDLSSFSSSTTTNPL